MFCLLPMRCEPMPQGTKEEFSSSLFSKYSYNKFEDSNHIMQLYRSQNKAFDRFVIDHILHRLEAYEVSKTDTYAYYKTNVQIHYIVTDHKVLEFRSSSFEESQIPLMIEM